MKNAGFKIVCVLMSQLWNIVFLVRMVLSSFWSSFTMSPNLEIHGSPVTESGQASLLPFYMWEDWGPLRLMQLTTKNFPFSRRVQSTGEALPKLYKNTWSFLCAWHQFKNFEQPASSLPILSACWEEGERATADEIKVIISHNCHRMLPLPLHSVATFSTLSLRYCCDQKCFLAAI